MWIVNPNSENIDKLKDIVYGADAAERVLDQYKNNPSAFDNDLIGLEAIKAYYEYYFYKRSGEMNYKVGVHSPVGRDDNLFNLLSLNTFSVKGYERITKTRPSIPFRQSFQTAAKAFRAIDSPTRGVVVPYGKEGEQIVMDLCSTLEIEKQYKFLKRAQRYSVNLLPHEFEKMAEKNAIREIQEGTGIFCMDGKYYSDQFGWQNEIEIKPDSSTS